MPTGYTADVADGKVTEFHDFALNCARAFGALIALRDYPEAPIPAAFKPHTWSKDRLAEEEAKLKELESLTPKQAELRAFREYEEAARDRRRLNEKNELQRERYETMLVKVRSWKIPSPDHAEMKKFMVDQLEESIRFDCNYVYNEPTRLSGAAWLEERITKAKNSIAYHTREWQKEVERTEESNRWVADLRASLSLSL